MNKFEQIYKKIISEMNYSLNNEKNSDDVNISVSAENQPDFTKIILTSKRLKETQGNLWKEPFEFTTFEEAMDFLIDLNNGETNIKIPSFYFNNLYYYEDNKWKSDVLYGEDKEGIISILEKYVPIVLKTNKQLKLQVNDQDMDQYAFTLTLE